MDWSMIGALGELVGALVVALSLGYLAIQVRMSNRLAKAEAWRSFAQGQAGFSAPDASDPIFRRGFAKVLYDGAKREDLDRDERLAVGM